MSVKCPPRNVGRQQLSRHQSPLLFLTQKIYHIVKKISLAVLFGQNEKIPIINESSWDECGGMSVAKSV